MFSSNSQFLLDLPQFWIYCLPCLCFYSTVIYWVLVECIHFSCRWTGHYSVYQFICI